MSKDWVGALNEEIDGWLAKLCNSPVRSRFHRLDTVIAERLFGWEWRRSSATGRRCLYDPTGHIPDWMQVPADLSEPLVTDWIESSSRIPNYTGSMADAWSLFGNLFCRPKPMQDRFMACLSRQIAGTPWRVYPERHSWPHGIFDLQPVMICLAALEAAYGEGEIATPRYTAPALDLVAQECQRQIDKGYDATHDDKHPGGELALAAACYAAAASETGAEVTRDDLSDVQWVDAFPWEEAADGRKRHDPIRLLIQAAALCVKEVERRLRAGEEIDVEAPPVPIDGQEVPP